MTKTLPQKTSESLQALLLPALVFVLPLHSTAICLILIIMSLLEVVNHLNTDVYPHTFDRHRAGKVTDWSPAPQPAP